MTSEIKKIREQLPLYVTGRLTEAEAAEVEAALKAHPELAAELKEFESIANAYQELEKETADPPDTLFERISDKIRFEQRSKETFRQKISIRDFLEKVFLSTKIAWGLAATQLIVIVFLLASGPSEKRYVTMTSLTPTIEAQVKIQVAFVETASEGELRALLTGLNASIVAGPTPQGSYTLRLKPGVNGRSEMDVLRKSPLVRFAEKILED